MYENFPRLSLIACRSICAFAAIFLFSSHLDALETEFVCRGEIEYSWMRMNKEGEVTDKEMKVFWASREMKAKTEELAKSKLEDLMLREKGNARQACKNEHENLSGCIAGKYQAMKTIMKLLDFSSRKAIEESVQKDCEAQLGLCKEVSSSEVACKDITPEDPKQKHKKKLNDGTEGEEKEKK